MYKLAIPSNNLQTLSKLYPNLNLLAIKGAGEGKSKVNSTPTVFGHKLIRMMTSLIIRKSVNGSNNAFTLKEVALDAFNTHRLPSAHLSYLRVYEELAGNPPTPLILEFQKYTPHRTIDKKRIQGDAYPDQILYRYCSKFNLGKDDRNSLLILEAINADARSKYMQNKEVMMTLRLPKMILLKLTISGWDMLGSEVII